MKTSQPTFTSCRRMLYLIPQSMATTRNRGRGLRGEEVELLPLRLGTHGSWLIEIAVGPAPLPFPPSERLSAAYLLDEIAPDETWRRSGLLDKVPGGKVDRGDHALHGALIPDVLGQGARVDPLNPHNPPPLEVGVA